MRDVLTVRQFNFPYTDVRFSGMNTGEHILFVTRESSLLHKFRLIMVGVVSLIGLSISLLLIQLISTYVPLTGVLWWPAIFLAGFLSIIGWWWVSETYRKSVFIITTRRLTKIIYTSPFTWYQFSLGLDEIQDTGSYASTYFEAMLGLGYFVARSGAGAVKNFKIVNITFAQDLHNYVNKLLYAFKHHPNNISEFRPFIPHVKGEERKELLKKYPEYKTEF